MKNLANMKNPQDWTWGFIFLYFWLFRLFRTESFVRVLTLQEAVHHIKLHVDIHLHMTGKAYQLGVCRPGQFKDVW